MTLRRLRLRIAELRSPPGEPPRPALPAACRAARATRNVLSSRASRPEPPTWPSRSGAANTVGRPVRMQLRCGDRSTLISALFSVGARDSMPWREKAFVLVRIGMFFGRPLA
jgi:hypothetical protein